MPYWQLFYHIVFATLARRPLLTPDLRQSANRLLAHKAAALGCVAHAVHAQPDHVHLALSIPPSIAVASIVGQLKGSSSRVLATAGEPGIVFRWQSDYGVLTVGRRHLGAVVRYIHDQDRRHDTADLWEELERTSGDHRDLAALEGAG